MKSIHLLAVLSAASLLVACSSKGGSADTGVNPTVVVQQAGGVCPQISGQYTCVADQGRGHHRDSRDHRVHTEIAQTRVILIGVDGQGRAVFQDQGRSFWADGNFHQLTENNETWNYSVNCDRDRVVVQEARAGSRFGGMEWTYEKSHGGLIIRTRGGHDHGQELRCYFNQH